MENEESYGDDDDDEWYSDDFDPAKAMEHSNDDEYIPPVIVSLCTPSYNLIFCKGKIKIGLQDLQFLVLQP